MIVLLIVALAVVFLHILLVARRTGAIPTRLLLIDVALAFAGVFLLRDAAGFGLEFSWWKELGQPDTFWRMLEIQWLPRAVAGAAGMLVFAAVFQAARRRCATALSESPVFSAVGSAIAAVIGLMLSLAAINPWTAALWWNAKDTAVYADPLFGRDLAFYFYKLPFYQMLLGWATAFCVIGVILYALSLLLGAEIVVFMERPEEPFRIKAAPARVLAALASGMRRGGAMFLVLLAAGKYLDRYTLLYSQHQFLYGADFVDARLGLPLYWAQIALLLGLAFLLRWAPRPRFMADEELGLGSALGGALPEWLGIALAVGAAVVLFAPPLLQGAVRSLYVRPNELTLERPYIEHHISATLAAFNLASNAREEPFAPRATETLDLSHRPDVAENIRLWDWEPFRNNVTQRQALRPYYAFPEVDTDRYSIDGRMRQVLIAARSLVTDLLPETAQTWVNLNLQYTHGYGAVAALVNSATEEGAPEMVLKDAPPQSDAPAFKITRPELYFDSTADAPVFVDSDQQEFDYPKGDDNVYNTYRGTAGIPVGTPLRRLAAAVAMDDWNILLTHYLTKDSRLLLHRQVSERVRRLAPFLTLDPDPYLVIDDSGRLFWMIDAYTMTDRHPYSQTIDIGGSAVNYIRNSVKVTVDAYNGTTHFYVFDEKDPLLAAYRNLLPELFSARSEMPADLQRHIRYPQLIFNAQAETYRTFHMKDPQVFYNKEDQWDVAKQVVTQEDTRYTEPYYAMLPLPGEKEAEFALMLPFTSRNRDNLIAWIAARCDPAHYGEIVFYRLPKEQLIYGPLQVQSRVDQDRDISKDLSLWNQQGSRVVRGSTLVLPVDGTFLYVEPLYIQATQAKMPELKKIVLAVGNRLVYADNLAQAIRRLAQPPAPQEDGNASGAPETAAPAARTAPFAGGAALLGSLRAHLDRYRRLTAEGKLSEAGRELDALQQELNGKRKSP
ncbi:MAG: UPF0182 family protein [Elusimicrobia bacterium]|nr:UPF0182 family protein [Elusimicrobiota bacterium]